MTEEHQREFFERAVSSSMDRIYGTAKRLARSGEDAERLAAESLARAFESLHELTDPAEFEGWILRIVTDTFVRHWREREELAATPSDGVNSLASQPSVDADSLYARLHQPFLLWYGSPEKSFVNNLAEEDVARALDGLPERYRTVVVMIEQLGQSYEEVGVRLNLPLASVRDRLRHGRRMLQDALWRNSLAERELMRDRFGKFVPREVVESIVREGGDPSPQLCEASVLVADIRGFTQLTGQLGPQRIVELLNEYFDHASRVIAQFGGTVTQFQGDAILAVFNVTSELARHADQAVAAAGALLRLVDSREFLSIRLDLRIGVNTGEVAAATVGGAERKTFTVHGEAVNLAARLEALNKTLGTRVLVAGPTFERMGDQSELRLVSREQVAGHTGDVLCYSPLRLSVPNRSRPQE